MCSRPPLPAHGALAGPLAEQMHPTSSLRPFACPPAWLLRCLAPAMLWCRGAVKVRGDGKRVGERVIKRVSHQPPVHAWPPPGAGDGLGAWCPPLRAGPKASRPSQLAHLMHTLAHVLATLSRLPNTTRRPRAGTAPCALSIRPPSRRPCGRSVSVLFSPPCAHNPDLRTHARPGGAPVRACAQG